MGFTLNTRKVDGHIIVELSGRLEHGDPCLQLRQLTKNLTSDGGRFFVLNMSGISYMDSAGLGLLLSIYATIRNQGGDLKLLNVSERVKDVLRATSLINVFQLFEDEDRAISSGHPQA